MSLPEPGERFDLGVLFVHGIGESRRGDTLVNWGGPLIETLRGLLRGQRGADDPAGPDVGKVRAVLRELPEDPAAPAHAEVTLTDITSLRDPTSPLASRAESRWLIAESCWGEEFPVPTVKAMARWSTQILPWTLVSHFDQALRRRGYQHQQAKNLRLRFVAWVQAILAGTGVILIFLAHPALVVLMYLLTLPAFLPIPSIRSAVAWCQRKLAGVLGDSYVFLGEPISRAAILERVRRDLAWLRYRGCDKIAVVAHSQGGAIAHALLRQERTSRCDLLATFGSGLRKLSEIEQAVASPIRSLLSWSTLCVLVSAAGSLGLLGSFLLRSQLGWATYFDQGLGTGVALLVLFTILSEGIVKGEPQAKRFLSKLASQRQMPLGSVRDWWHFWKHRPFLPNDATVAGFLRQVARRREPVPIALLMGILAGTVSLIFMKAFLMHPFEAATFFAALAGLLIGKWLYISWQVKSGRAVETGEQEESDAKRFAQRFQLPQKKLAWLDLFASHDPVPAGPLLDSARVGPEAVEVTNLTSSMYDHTSYWYNRDEFVVLLLHRLLGLAGLDLARHDPAALDRVRLAWLRRRWRMAGRTVARWGLVTSFLVTLGLWAVKPPPWAASGLATLRSSLEAKRWLPALLDPDPALGFLSPLGIAVLTVVFLVLGTVARAAWHAWNRRDMDRWLRHQRFGFLPGFYLFGLALLAAPPLATAATRWPIAAGALALGAALVAIALRGRLRARSASLPLADALAAGADRLPPHLAPTPPAG